MSVIVRQYGLLDPLNWGEDCQEHLYLMNRFWNALVEIEHGNRRQYREIIGNDEDVATIQSQIDQLKQQKKAHDEARKQARIKHRAKTGPHTAVHDQAMKTLTASIKDLSAQAKLLRAQAKERVKASSTALTDLETTRREKVKKAYGESGLWWGNYNAILASYKVARSRAMKEGAELRFHRFDGSGRFTCQIQDGMSAEELTTARHSIAQVRLLSGEDFARMLGGADRKHLDSRRDRRQQGVLSLTIYTGKDEHGKSFRRTLDFPIILHRPLPDEAMLKSLTVTRKRVGPGKFQWAVTFTFTAEGKPIEHPSTLNCGINLGWKKVAGGLRIATIFDGREARHLLLPQAILDKLDYVDDLKSRLDTSTNENFAWVLENLKNPPESLVEQVARMKRMKKPHSAVFARLVLAWRECPDYLPELYQEAKKRRKSAKRIELEHHHLRDKTLRRRQDLYRNLAKEIAEKYSLIALDKMDLRELARTEKQDGQPNELVAEAKKLRGRAALSELREWIVKQCAKTGSQVEVFGIKSSQTCNHCGQTLKDSQGLTRVCLACGQAVDVDINAAANLLRELG